MEPRRKVNRHQLVRPLIAQPSTTDHGPRTTDRSLLSRLHHWKGRKPTETPALGPEMISFFKQSVQKRQTKLTQIAAVWGMLVPETLNDHCALDGLHRSTLTVIVDSPSHLYELKQLLLAGLQQQLFLACKAAGLRKITLKPGRWYDTGEDGRKLRFQ